VAVWLLLFTLPLLVLTPDHRAARPQPVRLGPAFREVGRTLKSLPRTPNLLRFLLARLVYNDGLTTLFAFGGIYAAGTFGMDLDEIILFGIVLNVTAGLGAFAMAPLDDRIGSKPTILLALGGLMVCGLVALVATDKSLFWIAGSALGLFVGPAQAASRTMMARLAPAERRAELFGFYALTGKVTAPLGPFLFGTLTWLFATQRAGMASVLFMFVLGTVLLTTVREPGRSAPEPAVGGP
jgi:UMF1 family MFS transporter